jgi:XTP/dITP diphosphohydrolase
MRKIIVGTRNAGKIREIQTALADLPFVVTGLPDKDIPEVEETGTTFQENAIIKARYYCQCTGEYCLADDSGLEVDALGGAPGVHSARYSGENASDAGNNAKILAALQETPQRERTARFRSVLALAGPDGSLLLTDGVCEGLILVEARGTGGFGYDPLFEIVEYHNTFGVLSPVVKACLSHRARAARQLIPQLMRLVDEGAFVQAHGQ